MGVRDDHIVEVTAVIGGVEVGGFRLPADESVSFGRALTCGISVGAARNAGSVSRVVATLHPSPMGWVVENGARTRLAVSSLFVIQGEFEPRAMVLLQRDVQWTLRWDYDTATELRVRYRPARAHETLPVARNRPARLGRYEPDNLGTAVAAHDLHLTPVRRRRLSALYAYLIEERPRPADLLGSASELTGESERKILNTMIDVREIVNKSRDERIEHMDDLGYYLVRIAGVLGSDDLLT